MQRRWLCRVLVGSFVLPGCGGPEAKLGLGGEHDEDSSETIRPFRDQWRTEAEVAFDYLDQDGNPQITNITIGGRLTADNFANRGDVIVEFAQTDNIKIELRRFTMASSQAHADEDFADLHRWAFSASVEPPDEIENAAEKNCLSNGWMNDCEIRVYYDGIDQISRSGADIRVTLPRTYRHSIEIITEDNIADASYHNRGNVCVSNLGGTADIELGSGIAYVSLAEDVTPMPTCPPDLVAECEGWPDGTGTSAWAQECPCISQYGEFGQVRIETHDAGEADMAVDVPEHLWAALTLRNEGAGQQARPDEDAPGVRCDAIVDVPGYVFEGDEERRDPWHNKGFLNHPSGDAIAGAGYNVQLTSSDCAPVSHTEDPDDFIGLTGEDEQATVERGNLQVCTGCLRTTSCDELLQALPPVPL